jgi:hypothetical protein
MSMGNEVCGTCGQHLPCRAICPHCQGAHCDLKGVHNTHGHLHCGANSELPSRWGGPAMVPQPTAERSMPSTIGNVGQLPNMQPVGANQSHVSPANGVGGQGVVTQGSEPPADLPEALERELNLV